MVWDAPASLDEDRLRICSCEATISGGLAGTFANVSPGGDEGCMAGEGADTLGTDLCVGGKMARLAACREDETADGTEAELTGRTADEAPTGKATVLEECGGLKLSMGIACDIAIPCLTGGWDERARGIHDELGTSR